MSRQRFLGTVLGLGVMFLMCFGLTLGQVWWLSALLTLAFGWLSFLGRVLPQVQWRWDSLAATLAVGAALGVGSHLFLRALWRRWHASGAPAWPVRWSVSLLALLVLLFAATMATVGAAHHVGWLLTTREPLVESSWARMKQRASERDEAERLCRFAGLQSQAGVAPERLAAVLLGLPDTQDAAERWFVLPGPPEAPGLLVFPRDPHERERAGAVRCGAGGQDVTPVSADELARLGVLPGGGR
ncbi:hypothetical protein [Melittangium boletus]|uniref:hypothetical protein n=1 Tax=Melittangium boletus TaxID=83453 RepID=UPI003DA4C3D3